MKAKTEAEDAKKQLQAQQKLMEQMTHQKQEMIEQAALKEKKRQDEQGAQLRALAERLTIQQ